MKLNYLLPLLLLFTAMLSCEQQEPETLWVAIGATQCANPWDGLGMGSAERNMTEYLRQNDIAVYGYKTEYVDSEAFVCAACVCPSGIVISVRIAGYDLNAATALGFQEAN